MNRVTFSFIFVFLLMDISQCKIYLVETEDKEF